VAFSLHISQSHKLYDSHPTNTLYTSLLSCSNVENTPLTRCSCRTSPPSSQQNTELHHSRAVHVALPLHPLNRTPSYTSHALLHFPSTLSTEHRATPLTRCSCCTSPPPSQQNTELEKKLALLENILLASTDSTGLDAHLSVEVRLIKREGFGTRESVPMATEVGRSQLIGRTRVLKNSTYADVRATIQEEFDSGGVPNNFRFYFVRITSFTPRAIFFFSLCWLRSRGGVCLLLMTLRCIPVSDDCITRCLCICLNHKCFLQICVYLCFCHWLCLCLRLHMRAAHTQVACLSHACTVVFDLRCLKEPATWL